MLDPHAAEDERPPLNERMDIVPDTDP